MDVAFDGLPGWYTKLSGNEAPMTGNSFVIEAVFENGVLRPLQPLSLPPQQHVTLIVQVPTGAEDWPADVATIYQELAAEECRLADAMLPTVKETWPALVVGVAK